MYRPFHRVRGFAVLGFAALCALLVVLPTAAINSSGTVKVSGRIQSTLTVGPSGPLVLVGTVRNGPNKKEWYYIYAVNGLDADPAKRGRVTFQSNLPWSLKLKAAKTAGDKKKMNLSSNVLRYSTTRPATFAEAAGKPVLGTSEIILPPTNRAPSSTTVTHYFLLHVSQGSGGTRFGANIDYNMSQVSSESTTVRLTLSFPGL